MNDRDLPLPLSEGPPDDAKAAPSPGDAERPDALPSTDEAFRLAVLRDYAMMDTAPEPALDELTELAAQLCGAPIALISLIDDQRQWFKSKVGTALEALPRELSFCVHALGQRELLTVPDATEDTRFADNPHVTGEPRIRFYAGAPLVTPENTVLGTLCVVDLVPRTLSVGQEQALRVLSRQVVTQMELHRQNRALQAESMAHERAEISLRRLVAIVESSYDAIVGRDLDGTITSWNPGAEKIFGYTATEMIGTSIRRLTPDDWQDEEAQIIARLSAEERVEHFETQRQTRDGRLIDVSITASPIKNAGGRVIGISTIARDVTVMKEREREVAKLNRLYSALSHVNQAIVWMQSREELFRKVCTVLTEFGGFEMAWIGWRDEGSQRLMPVAESGDNEGYLQTVEFHTDERPTGRGPSGTACREGRPMVCNDGLNDPVMQPWRSEVERRGWRATAAFPIRMSHEVCGVLTVHASEAGYFRDKEVALLVEAAGDISFALDNLARDAARRQAQANAQGERLFSETMIESMPGILYFYDDQGRFLRWNQNFETVSGYSREEIARMHPLDFFASEDRRSLQERIDEVFALGDSALEAPFLSKDGRSTPYFFTGRRIVFDGKTCLVGVGIDISEQKRVEMRLRSSEANLARAQRIGRLGSWELDLATNELTWSEQVYRIFGIPRTENRLTFEMFLDFIHPEDRRKLEATQARVRSGETNLAIEHRILRPDRAVRWVYELAELEKDEHGRPTRLLGTSLDITARKKVEQLLVEARDSLELKVTARTAELQAALIRAEAADRLKSAFLATMSHELRTPLNSIIGFTGTVLLGLAGPLNEEQSKQLGMVRGSARHLLELINDVLDLSKIEADQLQVRAEPFDLRSSLERVAATAKVLVERKGLELTIHIAPEIGEIVSDRRRVEQIVINLLNNAIKFTVHGTIRLTAELVADFCLSPEAVPRPAVRLRVADTGIGIKEEDLSTLFLPFRQVDTGLARTHEGTGLGLAICRRLVGLLGGRISIASEWTKGTEFTVTFPLQPPSPS